MILLFAFQFACYAQIIAKTSSMHYLFLFAFQLIIFFAAVELIRMIYPDGNRMIMNHACMLLVTGIVMISRIAYDKAVRQFVIASVSLVLGLVIPELFYRLNLLKRLWVLYALTGTGALVAVLLLGRVVNGSRLNYTIMGLTFQPSELVKIVFILCIAGILQDKADLKRVALSGVIAAVHVLVLVMSKDLGSGLIYFVTWLALVFAATGGFHYLALGVSMAVAASAAAYRIFPHIRSRVRAFKDPWSEIEGAGYQVAQSLFGISSGGAFGLGLYAGSPGDIPFVASDAIFAGISEEMGIVTSVSMTLICVSVFVMMMSEAVKLKDRFCRLTAVGIGITYIFQVFLTIGGTTKFVPLTGVTLPLVSYGGTSVMVTLIMFGIFEGICLVRSEERFDELTGAGDEKTYDEAPGEDGI